MGPGPRWRLCRGSVILLVMATVQYMVLIDLSTLIGLVSLCHVDGRGVASGAYQHPVQGRAEAGSMKGLIVNRG